jgi:hypothetical protein
MYLFLNLEFISLYRVTVKETPQMKEDKNYRNLLNLSEVSLQLQTGRNTKNSINFSPFKSNVILRVIQLLIKLKSYITKRILQRREFTYTLSEKRLFQRLFQRFLSLCQNK